MTTSRRSSRRHLLIQLSLPVPVTDADTEKRWWCWSDDGEWHGADHLEEVRLILRKTTFPGSDAQKKKYTERGWSLCFQFARVFFHQEPFQLRRR